MKKETKVVDLTQSNGSVVEQEKPQVQQYEPTVTVSPDFVKDVTEALQEYPYASTSNLIKAINQGNGVMTVNTINQVLQGIAQFPYRSVVKIMTVVENPETQTKYFTPSK